MSIQIVRRVPKVSYNKKNGEIIHPVLERIYAHRDIQEREEIDNDLKKLLPYDSLKDIDKAIELLFLALQKKWRICIVGDFDADGATSSALAVRVLRKLGAAQVDYLVPNRFEYGYGLSPEIVEVAARRSPDLIITVDNGSSSFEGVALAQAKGIKLLITDHHSVGERLPAAEVIINPNQHGDLFPSKNLAGVGVIFYVLIALRTHLRKEGWFEQAGLSEPNLSHYLDLVALGTIADMVPLDKNNRILVHQGLARIRRGLACPGIRALLQKVNRNLNQLTASDLGFIVSPRLNAAGRLEDMALGIECLLTDDESQAERFAARLNQLNEERRQLENKMSEQAFTLIKNIHFKELPYGICLFNENWHQGIIGLLAARIKEKYHRPVVVFAPFNEMEIKGSARSVGAIHIRDLLDSLAQKHPHLLEKFGGHAMAAGLSLNKKNYDEFQSIFNEMIREKMPNSAFNGILYSDGELDPLDLSFDLVQQLLNNGPWGTQFPEPLFDGIFRVLDQRRVKEKHIKFILNYEGKILDAIIFNIDLKMKLSARLDKIRALYKVDYNTYQEKNSVQLILEHIEAL